jgi:hypothetical protein
MAEVRTFSTEMQIEVGATADYDLEVDGYYDAPVGGRYLGPPDTRRPPEPPRYRIFQARARTLSSRPAIVGRWVDLPMSLFTADQIRHLELQGATALAEGDGR